MFLLIGSMDHIEGICHKKDAVCNRAIIIEFYAGLLWKFVDDEKGLKFLGICPIYKDIEDPKRVRG